MTTFTAQWQGITPTTGPASPRLSALPSIDQSVPPDKDGRTRDLSLVAPVAVVRDLAYAAALLEAAGRMRSASDLPSLLSAIAAEGSILIQADDVAVIRYIGIRRTVIDVHVPNYVDDKALLDSFEAAGHEHWFVDSGLTTDLADDSRWTTRQGPLSAVSWRSVMAVPLASSCPQNQIRLLWFSRTPGAFASQTAVAELFGCQANLVIEYLDERINLNRAITARHRIGQAQGVLMARHHVPAEEAFRILRQASQNTNVKLRTIAEKVISEFS